MRIVVPSLYPNVLRRRNVGALTGNIEFIFEIQNPKVSGKVNLMSNTEVWDLMTLSSLDTSPLFTTLTLLYYSMIVVSCSVHVLRLQDMF